MKNILPALALIGCTKVNSNLPDTTTERCDSEIQAVIEACEGANVIGTNDNLELFKAVNEAKACFGDRVKITCSDTEITKIVQFNQL